MMLLFTECFMTRTKLRTIFTVLSSSLLLLSSCSQQEENLFLPTNDLSLTCIQSTWAGTRATMDNEGQGNFSEGDQIELRIAGEKKNSHHLVGICNRPMDTKIATLRIWWSPYSFSPVPSADAE